MSLVGVPSMAHSRPCHTFSPNFQTKTPFLVHCQPISPLFRSIQHSRASLIVRSSNLRDETPQSLPDQFPNDDQGPIKFQPFVARNELRRRMLGYYRELPTPNGQVLIVQPVSEEWVEPAADLLTEAFADSIGYMSIYKNFLRRQIRNYLRSHMNLPPKTVCLVALLVYKEVIEKQPQIDEDSGFYSDLEASEGESGGGGGGQNFDSARGSAADVAGGMMGDGMGNNIWPSFSSNHSSSSTSEEDATSSTLRSSGGGGGGSDGARSPRVNPTTATLVGAVEVSFTESTRSKEWTGLNPPPERPYLCNMAVADNVRRQGIGGLLLKAAEELVQQVGEDQMYLHLRFKDAPAQALYRKAGYIPAAQDSIFVMLVGQDRRWLMKKILTEEQL